MSERTESTSSRLQQLADTITMASSILNLHPRVVLNENGIPNFDALPLQPDHPPHSAWGLYGPADELGTLNRLTDAVVASAAREEIKSGTRISLNWPLNAQGADAAFYGRQAFTHTLKAKPPRLVNDDIWTLNSQSSTQWDGLRHFGYQREKVFYNGVTMEDIHAHNSTVNGIQAWAKRGIVGRGVLIDYHRWRLAQLQEQQQSSDGAESCRLAAFDAFESTPIRLADLQACLTAQGTELRFGDVLLVRSGWQAAHAAKTEEELAKLKAQLPHRFCGVEQSEDVLRWLWGRVAAVGGDQPAFECWPRRPDVEGETWLLHEVLLSGWGCPLGELFDLEALAEVCEREKRWSFFFVSEPCDVPGGVASPPNALAIF